MKKIYKKPVLQKFGKIIKVTQGGASGHNDPGGPQTAKVTNVMRAPKNY